MTNDKKSKPAKAGKANQAAPIETNEGINAKQTWLISGDTVTQNLSRYSERPRAALNWLYHFCVENGIHRDDVARELRVSGNTLYKLYTLKHRHPQTKELLPPSEKLVRSIEKKQQLEMKRAAFGKTEFVMTPSARKIFDVCDLCQASNSIGFVWGKSHIGKTWAIEEYRRIHNHGLTKLVRVPTGSGKHELIKLFAAACAISTKSCYDKLKERVIRSITADNLILIDEFHLLAFTYQTQSKHACVELVREIHDRTKCGMVICGTHIFRNDIEIGKDRDLLEQLSRRGVFKLELGDEPTRGDLAAICKSWDLEYPKGELAERFRSLSQQHGLKAVTEAMRLGNRLATKSDQSNSWDFIVKALDLLEDMRRKPRFQ